MHIKDILSKSVPERMAAVQDPVIPLVWQWADKVPGTISLGQGQVYYYPPESVYNCTARDNIALLNKYGNTGGMKAFTDKITDRLSAVNMINVEKRKNFVFVTAGANMAFFNIVLSFTNQGDEVILLSPYYFNYDMALRMLCCKPVFVDTTDGYQPDVARIESAITPRTKAVVTISPNNPTGAVYTREALTEINRLCLRKGIYHISDEAYESFVYDGMKHFSPASMPGSEDHTITLFSFSKGYGMAGWRLGYMVAPGHLLPSLKKVQDTDLICPPIASQLAGLNALNSGYGYPLKYAAEFESVRNAIIRRFEPLGDKISYAVPGGAIYFFLKLNSMMSSLEMTERLINEFKVAVLPGNTFGVEDSCSIRISYGALNAGTVNEGIDRLVKGISALC